MSSVTQTENTPVSPTPARPRRALLRMSFLIFPVILGSLFAAGALPRMQREQLTQQIVAEKISQPPRVIARTAEIHAGAREITLPGSMFALRETALHPRVDGYLTDTLVDIGDRVTAGQLLARIDAPELEANLEQARAQLTESKAKREQMLADVHLAQVSFDRQAKLLARDITTRQEYDDYEAALQVAKANQRVAEATILAQQANVRRLEKLVSFQEIRAPFAGVITARSYDPGALVAGDQPGQAAELFRVAQIDVLRVFVDVPQEWSTQIKPGDEVQLQRREHPDEQIAAKVTRTTNSLSPETRTLRVEIQVDNPNQRLLPGMYVRAHLQFDETQRVRIPSAALITRGTGTRVAVINDAQKIVYHPVTIGQDFGSHLEIQTGLKGGELLALRPGDDLPEGTRVHPVERSE
ncbi:efflux RND transporter periplasmic adaptor subunit [Gimesia sp.]|uniref:efflux RND transporter periplasmic adaptor subunit n=1 Tax=Gimesia sp. TaxID=2024833 RepID=UPI003A8CA4C8